MADRCEDDVKEKPKKLPEKLLERERLLSLVFSWVPRVTWRVDDPEIQHSKNYSRVSGSTEREKSGTNELPEYFSVISEAENLLDGRGAHPETIPSLRGRIYKAFESSPKPDDTTSDEHFILRLIAQKTLVFLLDELQKRHFDWEVYKITHEKIKELFQKSRELLDSLPTREKCEKRNSIFIVKFHLENIRRRLSPFEKLEELFSGDENMDSFSSRLSYHRKYDSKCLKMEEKFRDFEFDAYCEDEQVKYFEQSAAEI